MTKKIKRKTSDDDRNDKLEYVSRNLPIAGLSAAFSEFITLPIDTVKVYVQLQSKISDPSVVLPTELEVGSAYSGLKSGHTHPTNQLGLKNYQKYCHEIYTTHGIKGFYRGSIPAILRATLNNALSATIYKPIREYISGKKNREVPLIMKILSGVITGSITQILAAPTDLLKVRMQADAIRTNPRYSGAIDAVKTIYGQSGYKGFYKGLTSSMFRSGLSVAATLGTYDHMKYIFLKRNIFKNENDTKLHLTCSCISATIATLIACPFDVIKTKYQSQSLKNPIYKNTVDTAIKIYKHNGLTFFWKGFAPMMARLGPWQVTFWFAYEKLNILYMGQSF